MKSFSLRYAALATLVCAALPLGANAQVRTREEQNRSFGDYVLDAVELGDASVSVSRKIRDRSMEIRREWTGDGAVTPDEDRRYREEIEREHGEQPGRGPKAKENRGNGPPDWAPAHGYRRNFGDQEREELGAYAHRQVEQGVRGDALIESLRGAVERISRGERVDDRASTRDRDMERNRDTERGRDGRMRDDDRGGDRDRNYESDGHRHSTNEGGDNPPPAQTTEPEQQRRPHRGDYDHDNDGIDESYHTKGGRFGHR
jgi:hypothetical protein